MNSRQLQIAAVEAADRFFAARPWQILDGEQVFAIELEGHPPIAGSVLGGAGQEYGLSLLVGERAVEELIAISEGRLEFTELKSTALWFTLTRRKQIEAPFDRALLAARREGRMAPLFMAKEAGQPLRPPRKAELEVLLAALRALQIVAADDRDDFEYPAESDLVSTLIVRGEASQAEVERVERAAPGSSTTPLQLVAAAAPPQLANLAVLDASYAVATTEVPMRIAGDSGPTNVVIVANVDEASLAMVEILDGDPATSAREKLFALFATGSRHAGRGLPSTLLVRNQALYALIGPELRAAGVDCCHQPHNDLLDDIIGSLSDHLLGRAAEQDPKLPAVITGRDDLDGWKAVDLEVTELLTERGARTALGNEKAWRKYLGCARTELDMASRELEQAVLVGYLDWYFHCYRATKRSRTIVERVLAGDLDDEPRAALTARDTAKPSLYRIEAVEVGEGVKLLDVLTGSTHDVADESMSLTGQVGLLLPARLYPVGAFEFAMPIGPAIAPLRVGAALRFLESDCELQLDDRIAAKSVHLLGRLWRWSESVEDLQPQIDIRHMDVAPLAARSPEAALEAVYMRWLDTPIPDLGGQTPRQACHTPAGRRRVTRMIRSYPDPLGSPGVQVPRDKMLAELGLLESGTGGEA